MTISNQYIESVVKKFKILFLNKFLEKKYIVVDAEKALDDVYFFDSSGGHIGLFINGANPFFTDKKLSKFDSFNLFATYDKPTCQLDKEFKPFEVRSISLAFTPKYNELLGFYLKGSSNHLISFIFQHDSVLFQNLASEAQFKSELTKNLRHVANDEFYFVDVK